MNTLERIRIVFSQSKMSQSDIARNLSVTPAYVWKLINKDNVTPSDRLVSDIAETFHVNANWIRTGEGEMFTDPVEDDLIARASKLLGEHDPFFEALVYMYSELSLESRNAMLEKGAALFAEALRRKKEKE